MAVIRQVRFFFAVAPTLAIPSAFVAVRNYNLAQLFSVVLSFLLIWSFMSSVNNTYDIETDRGSQLMKTQNPIVTGELSLREAQAINLVLPVLSIVVGVFAGPYWIGLPLIAIILVVLYDIKPFRLKDRALGFLIAPLSQCLPFLFSYATAISGFALPTWVLFVFAFLYFNGVVVTRFLPDMELDLRLGIHNFSATYGAEATRMVDIVSTVLAAATLMVGMFLGGLSLIGVPLLLLSIALQLRVLAQGADALKNPAVFRMFALGMIPNSVSMTLSVVGSAL
jgi:4-hydroxybenzoate polyprenyltransferase